MDSAELGQEDSDLLQEGTEFADLEEVASADGHAMLRYEEHITELLVTIAELNGRIEALQHSEGREEDEFFDQCSQYTSSLPRYVWQPKGLEVKPQPDETCEGIQLPAEAEECSELFAELQQVLSSLENVVSCRRNRTLSLQSCPDSGNDHDVHSTGARVEECNTEKWREPFEELDEMEEVFGVWSELTTEEQSWYKAEVTCLREKNLALKQALGGKEEELNRSKGTLRSFQEERDRLQRKVKDLQDSLQRVESPPLLPSSRSSSFSGALSPSTEEECCVCNPSPQDPIATIQSFIKCLQNCSRVQHLCQVLPLQSRLLAPETKVKELEAHIEHQKGCIDKLKCLNDLLVVTLEECKSDSERLSMMLGKHESDSTALHMAVQASERHIAVQEVLQMLSKVKLELRQLVKKNYSTSPDETLKWQSCLEEFESKKKTLLSEARTLLHEVEGFPMSDGKDSGGGLQQTSSSWNSFGLSCEEKCLKDYLWKLRQDQASIKVTLVELALKGPTRPVDVARISDVIKAKVDDAIEASVDILPGYTRTPILERSQLLQNLSTLREQLADLKAELHLRKKENRVLELQALAQVHQENAYVLLMDHLKWQLEDGSERRLSPVSLRRSAGGSSSGREVVSDRGPEADEEIDGHQGSSTMRDLERSVARCNELQAQIQMLSVALEKSTRDDGAKKRQSIDLTRDFFRAYSNLLSSYKNSRKKQADQLWQLEKQVEMMSRWQLVQARNLQERIEQLEAGRAVRVQGETSL